MASMKASFVGLGLLIILPSCSHPFDPDAGPVDAVDLLYEAYEEQSEEKLRAFFARWQRTIQPITKAELATRSDKERALYSLYEAFYDPRYPARLGGSEWGDGIYADAEYFIVQNKLYYRQVPEPGGMDRARFDSDEEFRAYIMSRDSLTNFRPRLSFPDRETVYLTGKFDSLITEFLMVAAPTDSWRDRELHAERERRRRFIGQIALIIPGHWFGWHILSHPEAYMVEIDSLLTRARVEFRIVYEGGYADFEQEDGEWALREARLVWIE